MYEYLESIEHLKLEVAHLLPDGSIQEANATENNTPVASSVEDTAGDELEYQLDSIKSRVQYLISRLEGDDTSYYDSSVETFVSEVTELLHGLQSDISAASSGSDVQKNFARLQALKKKLEAFIAAAGKNWVYMIPMDMESQLTAIRTYLDKEVCFK